MNDLIYNVCRLFCYIGLHRRMAYYDLEYSAHGEYYYCYYCDTQFDKNGKKIHIK